VNAFDGKVSRENEFVSRRDSQHCAIVTDADHYSPAAASKSADSRYQQLFS
jgi:hypothetical protein